MDKPSSGEKAVERSRAAVGDQIKRLVRMARGMKMEPDLSPVWDGEEFRGLPPEVRAEIIEQAKKEGYATPEPAPTAPQEQEKKEEPDPRTESVRNQIARIAKMARSMKMEPDLSPVWEGDDFSSLPADLRTAVRRWAAEQGLSVAEAPAETPVPAPEPAAEPSREKRERREGPKRKFLRYRVMEDAGDFAVHEDYQEWDDDARAYKTKTIKTSVGITGPLREKLASDPDVAETVAGFAGQVRGELDADGVKIFIDRPKNDPDRMYPKWKYTLEGRTVQEPIRLDDIPAEIVELVKADKDYYRAPAWKKWFGKQMQRKREDVISAELAKLFPEAAPRAAEAPKAAEEPREAETAPVREPEPLAEPATEKVPEEASMTPELAAGIHMLVDKFAPLFELPRDAGKLIEYVTQFSKGIVELQIMKSGVKKRGLPAETLKRAVRAALLEKYKGDGATSAEITRLMADQGAAASEEDEVIEVQDEWIEESVPDKKETPEEAAYRALRHDLDALGTPGDLAEFVTSLRELKKSNIGSAAGAAERLLSDIEFGKAGALTEERMEGLDRSDKERAFFERHPALDRRNVQPLEDGRVIAHIDRERPADAMRRALRAAVDDALASRGIGASPEIAAKIADYLLGIVTGRNPNEQVMARFTRDLAAYDAGAEELTVKNIEKLGGVIANLASEIEAKRKR